MSGTDANHPLPSTAMTDPDFEEIGRILTESGPSGFDALAERFIAAGNFPAAFEARLMKKRLEMDLPLMASSANDLSDADAKVFAATQIDAARETGTLFLEQGDIRRAWPYFRAVGDSKAIREAIENFQAGEDSDRIDGAIEVGLYEAVHPEKGLELMLRQHGVCRTITTFAQYPDEESRERSGTFLIRSIYEEVRENIRSTIEAASGDASTDATLLTLIEGRDDLFEGNAYYIDTSHVISILRYAIEFTDPEALQMAYELTEYGRRLGEMFQFKGQFPFEEPFPDYGAYLRALLGDRVEESIEHFRDKITPEPDPFGDVAAQTLVTLLVRLDRFSEAIDIAEERLSDVTPDRLTCPGPLEICEMAGDLERLKTIAEKTGNRLAYAAATVGLSKSSR